MEGTVGSQDPVRLRRLGAELRRLGVPWLLTVFGLSGVSSEDILIVPLLWFATPVLLWRLRHTTRVAPNPARAWLLAAVVLGVCCWTVAVPASLLGAAQVTRSAHWLGTWIGLALYCTAMVRLSVQLRWPAYERRWLQAARTAVLAVGLAVLAGVGMLAAEVFDWPEQSGAPLVTWVLLVGALVVDVVALVRTARIHTPTNVALLSIPAADGTSGPFSVGVHGDRPTPPAASGPVQQE